MRTNQLHEIRKNTPATHYAVEECCDNCGVTTYLTIPKGQTEAEYLKGHPVCEYCGCKFDTEPCHML